jgi:exoribonuclease R
MKQIVGVLELTSKYRYGLTSRGVPMFLFTPYDESLPAHIVGCSHRDLTVNQIAYVEINPTPSPFLSSPPPPTLQKPRGNLLRLLGPVGDFLAERDSLLLHYCPIQKMDTKLLQGEQPVVLDTNRDLLSAETGWTTFHVDPPGCRDVDDAMAWHPTRGWAITIADASAAVPEESPLDLQARVRGSTFYDLEGRVVVPMLPPNISEESASLLPGEARRGVTYFTDTQTFALSCIVVAHSYTYDSFPANIYGIAPEKDPHDWIADMMILYNTAVANILHQHSSGIMRVQKPADADAVKHWTTVDPSLRFLAMESATYEVADAEKEQGHASMGLDVYCHASSPLRRYADLLNQRILKQVILGTSPSPPASRNQDIHSAIHLNERQKANRRWTRDLTFLTHVTPGKVHVFDVQWLSDQQVWVPAWKRVLRIRHTPTEPSETGTYGQIQIFCDPTKRNWKQRVLTAPAPPSSPNTIPVTPPMHA